MFQAETKADNKNRRYRSSDAGTQSTLADAASGHQTGPAVVSVTEQVHAQQTFLG